MTADRSERIIGAGRVLERYRAFIVAVLAVLLVTLLAGRPEPPGSEVGTGRPGAGDGAVPAAVVDAADPAGAPPLVGAAPDGEAATANTPVSTGAGPRAAGAPAGRAPGAAAPTGRPAAAPSPQAAAKYPGIGTPEALANPNCDPATGRIRFPSAFAPACVAPWPDGADNGGRTSQGVTADKIKLAVYGDFDERERTQWRNSLDTYNKHFELWGRQVEPVFFTPSGTDEVAQRADATQVATRIAPFISTVGPANADIYSQELASRGVVTLDFRASWADTQRQAPFRWSAEVDDRTAVHHIMEFAGKRVAGRNSQWAGSPDLNGTPRKLGLVHPETWDRSLVDQRAAHHGVKFADIVSYDANDAVSFQERARTHISRLRGANVTTVVAGADFLYLVVLTRAATNQLWFPEWMITGWGLQDTNLFGRLFDPQQWQHAFGLGPINARIPPDKYETQQLYLWHHGVQPPDGGNNGTVYSVGKLMFPGLQLAGPNLTAATFRDGMFRAPPSGGVWCNCTTHIGASFGRHRSSLAWDDYSGWDDYTEVWWDPTSEGWDEAGLVYGPGVYRRVAGGVRYNAGEWPATATRAFDPDGAVAFYDDYPPNDRPPQYKHEPHD